ncbi:NifU family protein [Candidatus Carsonella ruddii]|uniref:Putative iron-sulfur cluster scaffold protein n=1 Tax=Candidatus Carsonella ruddii PC isolate NHV TaxID=1202540 RepID=J3YQQ8_CARRU|nr:NifU family protein [Candidatus Carsonella ruddii]AFP84313.1 putative iron-sulfur cluster scaffold protein [Candidatus Carsonella ruddii PC isolate NHV]
MNIINLFNYKFYISDSCYLYLFKNIKNNFYYKIFIKNKGNNFSKVFLYYSNYRKNLFSKLIKVNNINIIIDISSICFLKNLFIHFKKIILINAPFSKNNMFLENKVINKIFFLIKYIINKKLLLHNGAIKIEIFNFKKKTLLISFLGNCSNCSVSKNTFNNFIIKIFKKIKFIKKVLI